MSRAPAAPSYGKYVVIWIWLIALLAAGTSISLLPLSKAGVVLLIMAVSLIKALLVILFYMHLKFEKVVPLWIVALSPFFLLGLAGVMVLAGSLIVG